MPLPDPATITIAAATVLTWLLGISFVLGEYSQRQKCTEKDVDGMAQTIKRIFEKLDLLAATVPHKCEQVQTIADIRTQIGIDGQRLTAIEARLHDQESVK